MIIDESIQTAIVETITNFVEPLLFLIFFIFPTYYNYILTLLPEKSFS